jgi:hypothetical protein
LSQLSRAGVRHNRMRLITLLFTAALMAMPVRAQEAPPPSSGQTPASSAQDPQYNLPVSLDKIKEGLDKAPTLSLRTLDMRPTFRVQILERQRIEELLATLNFKTTKPPAGGLYWADVQRQMWPAVDNPMMQPYAAFNQGQLLTLLIEAVAGKYLAGKAVDAITKADRARAEASAREEVHQAIREYCGAQPNGGAAIAICQTSSVIR